MVQMKNKNSITSVKTGRDSHLSTDASKLKYLIDAKSEYKISLHASNNYRENRL